MLDFAFGFWKTKLKREIVKAKTHNRKSKNSKLRQMHIPSNFVQVYNAVSLRYKRIEKFHNANLFEDWKYAKRGGVSYNVPLDALFFAFGIYHMCIFVTDWNKIN
jgi:histidinol dehydrogenase